MNAAQQQFLEEVKEGKWFRVEIDMNVSFLVKMKPAIHPNGETMLESLWLSDDDHEGMTIEEYYKNDWSITDNTLTIRGKGTNHIGSFDNIGDETSIYDEDGLLVEEKLKRIVLENVRKDFLSQTEFDSMWTHAKENNIQEFPLLSYVSD